MRVEVSWMTLDGAHCTSMRWWRFDLKRTRATGGLKLFREGILNNVINFTLPAGCTDFDVVEQIAQQSQTPIPIEMLPTELKRTVHPRGRTCFGFSGNYLDEIARNYDLMQWWVSKNGLNIAAINVMRLSEFDALAGKLMFEARLRGPNGRLTPEEYREIAAKLDEAAFKPRQHLEGKTREELANWNKKHPRKAVHTFCAALAVRIPELNLQRAVQRRLSRAKSAWEKQLPLSER
jgi:hypothetical protein